MFDCYLRFMEVITAAGAIVEELQNYCWRAEKYQPDDRGFQHTTSELQVLCNQQAVNLLRLSRAVGKLAPEIAVSNPEVGTELERFVLGHRHVLWCLANLLGTGYYYTGPAPELPKTRIEALATKAPGFDRMKPHSLFLRDQLGLDELPEVRRYLRFKLTAMKIEELRQSAMKLRELIVANFSLDEVLWRAEDFRDRCDTIYQEDVTRSTCAFPDDHCDRTND